MIKEWLARILIVIGLLFGVAIPVAGWWQQSQDITLHGRMAETGGWTPEVLSARVGEPLNLRLTSDDVTHGFAVGQSDQAAVEVIPGEITEVSLVFDQPGKYTFYCTRWCSVNHWRMRGTIEVTGSGSVAEPGRTPLYVTLGLDLDADHQAQSTPAQFPAAWRGALLSELVPEQFKTRNYYLTNTPVDLWSALRGDPALNQYSDQQVWDLVAWVWQNNTTAQEIQLGQKIYTANCAACHGENGAGNGVFAAELAASGSSSEDSNSMGERTQQPADFTDPEKMLSASPAHLQGKIIRGGMGTGMPYWGPILTEEQTWALVAYLWNFQFK